MANEEEIRAAAIDFAKHNKKRLAEELTNKEIFKPDAMPVSVFMAGSPGAGKTEFSKNLILVIEKHKESRVIRIDPDDIRALLPGYTGNNSYLFQGAVSLVVEKIHDLALRQKQNFIFDGTFSKYNKAIENINRSLGLKRSVVIFYLYQKADVAWRFTQLREKIEGRNIPREKFDEQFRNAKEAVNRVRINYGDEVGIFLVKKDFEKNSVEYIDEIVPGGKNIDEYPLSGYI